jgi:nucleotide-binding universal stress UspA family protein
MKTYKKIMVACDLSEHALSALEHAAGLVSAPDTELIVVNVINQRDYDAIVEIIPRIAESRDSYYLSPEEYLESIKHDRTVQIKEMIRQSGCPLAKVRVLFRMGVPFRELVAAVCAEKVDLLVMGSRGRSKTTRMLFGSTAEKMFRHCPCPLLSIRAAADRG